MQAERQTFRGDGVDIAADVMGPEDGPILLFLHGGGQTRQSWGKAVREAARRGYLAITLDLRGHGDSGWSPDGIYRMDRFVGDLRAVLADLKRPPILVGASMGGLIGMSIAGASPDALAGLVLVDVTPRIEAEGAQEVAAFMSANAGEGFASLEEAADAVAAYLPHRERPRDTSGLARNLRQRDGRWYWHWDPAFLKLADDPSAPGEAAGALAAAAKRIAVPTLLIRGGRSRIVSRESVEEFRALVPHADYVDIADADHMVAGDDNDAFNAAVFAFVERVAELNR